MGATTHVQKYSRSAKNDADTNATSGADWEHYDVTQSPFLEIHTPFTAWETIKMLLLILTVPIRALLSIALLALMGLLSTLASIGWPEDQPLPPRRRLLVGATAWLAGGVLWLCFVRLRVVGYDNYKAHRRDRMILIFNHSSYLDGVVLMHLFAPSGVSKASNAHLPLVGRVIRSFQNIYVPENPPAAGQNGNGGGAAAGEWDGKPRMNLSALITQRASDPRYPLVCLAPEGTCGDNRCILQFKTGAFVGGLPVLPVMLRYNVRWNNPSWTIITEWWNLLRLLCQFDNCVEATVLPPYHPSAAERANPKLYAANAVVCDLNNQVCISFANMYITSTSILAYAHSSRAVYKAGLRVSWDGRTVLAPPGVLDASGRYANLLAAGKKAA